MELGGFPLLGEPFPSMEVMTTHGTKKLPEDYKGKWFVLFSHPGDFTPVCTTEFIEFAKKSGEFKQLNAEAHRPLRRPGLRPHQMGPVDQREVQYPNTVPCYS